MQEIRENSKFLWVGNWAAIDLINTDIVMAGKPVDLLGEVDDVILWLRESHLCDDGNDLTLPMPTRLLDEARAYRALLRQGIEDLVRQWSLSTELLSKTNAYLRRSVSSRRLQKEGERYRFITNWHFQSAEDCLVPIAESFATLAVDADVGRIRKCKNPECVLCFYDTSKGGQRTWCSLDICGNKLRMAASRRRSGLS